MKRICPKFASGQNNLAFGVLLCLLMSDSLSPIDDLRQRALVSMKSQQWREALTCWEQWWTDMNLVQDPDAMHDRAVCHFHCGEGDLALKWLDLAVEVQPEYSYRYASRGWMKQALQDDEGARLDYEKALVLDPEDAITLNNLGLLEERMGYKKQARERFKVSNELRGILQEHGIDTETRFESQPRQGSGPSQPSNTALSEGRSTGPHEEGASTVDSRKSASKPNTFVQYWVEITRALSTAEGRKELWGFIRNGFTLRR
ncbi:MAG: tetratricopeptide repeat protein [Bacteroidetes bacterium]|nr:tetratricopeptide repeat protein [Bacteroidota bacterium]MDA0904062.1 tetratricopeptide repeat protein [Bacteroidota bacterium]MDA1242696.1 tetratricopeptide repeat protein [Bacteroidota bacterium]